ncbi:hypothetical protein R6Q57_004530 [Mikania cordata]
MVNVTVRRPSPTGLTTNMREGVSGAVSSWGGGGVSTEVMLYFVAVVAVYEAEKMEIAINHDTRSSDDGSSFGSDVETDVEDTAEARLITRKPRRQLFGTGSVPGLTKASTDDGEPSENTAYLDKYGGAIEDLNIQKLLNVVQYDANGNEATKPAINDGGVKAKSDKIEEEIVEEEVVELEFENAIPKLHTHTMHCPNCDHHITKVVLRRKIIKSRPLIAEEQHEPVDLLGCFSCFSLFTFSGNGGFNPFPIFGKKATSSAVPRVDGNDVVREDGKPCPWARNLSR